MRAKSCLPQAPDWQLSEEAHHIERSFRFSNFRDALTFVQEVGELAEAEGHHPNISFGWGNATVSLPTKKTTMINAMNTLSQNGAQVLSNLAPARNQRLKRGSSGADD